MVSCKRYLPIPVVLSVAMFASVAGPQTQAPRWRYRPLHMVPDPIAARLEARDRLVRTLPKSIEGFRPEYVIQILRRWRPGQTVTVAFLRGDTSLHQQIEMAASEWLSYGNLKLDFGYSSETNRYRSWSPADQTYTADIRIAFIDSGPLAGYWSYVGRDSIDQTITKPNEPSMSFGDFAAALPAYWRSTVLHEFGHALGFEHEHQHPTNGCDEDFRWDDDPGYIPTLDANGQYVVDSSRRRPGVYTVYGGYPNHWPKYKVDFALRQLRDSHAFDTSAFDRKSIMKYYFEEWMFRQGNRSHCYSDEATELSQADRRGVALAYPKNAQAIQVTVARQTRLLKALIGAGGLPPDSRSHYQQLLKALSP